MKRDSTNQTCRRIGLAVLVTAFVPLLATLTGCPGVGGDVTGMNLAVLTPTIDRDLAANQKVTIVYNATGSIDTLEGIYSTDATPGSNEVSIVQGLPLGENQFFDLDLSGVPAGQTLHVGIRASNAAGSISAYATATVRVNGLPAPTFGAPDGTGFPLTSLVVSQGDIVPLQFNLNDPENNVSWTLFYDVDNVDNGTVGVIERGSGNEGSVDWNTGSVPPGQYFIGVSFVDNVGNTGVEYGTGTVTITRGPLINVFQPAQDLVVFGNQSVPIEFSGRDPSGTASIRVFYDTDDNLDNGGDQTIEDNLPTSATTLSSPWQPAAQFVPSGTFFIGATITGPAGVFTNFAPGRVTVVREPSLQLVSPAGDTTFAAEAVVTIQVLSNLPGSAGSITVFYQTDADADGVGEGAEIPITAAPVPADTREIPWDTTGIIDANDGLTTYVVGARMLVPSTGQILEDFSGVVTLTTLPTIVMLKPAANVVRDPVGILEGLFEAIDPDSAENLVGIFLDPDLVPLSGNELCALENLDDCTQFVETTDPQPFNLDLSRLAVGTYHFLFTAQDESGITQTFYGRNHLGEVITLTILRERIAGAFYVGDIEAPSAKNRFPGAIFQGHNFQDNAGSSFVPLGDMNGDGVDDLLITSMFGKPQFIGSDGIGRGEANLIFGKRRDPDEPSQGPFVNPQPFDGTMFTFDVNITDTSILPGRTATGVRRLNLEQTNGLSAPLLVPDMDGDGREELAFGMSFVNSTALNPRTCTLFWFDDFNTGGINHRGEFACGSWTGGGQFTPGGIVFLAGSNLPGVSGRVLDLNDAGVTGFSGNPELFTVDNRHFMDPPPVIGDSLVTVKPQGNPVLPDLLPAGWTVEVTAFVWSSDRFSPGCEEMFNIACATNERIADTDPATERSDTFVVRICGTAPQGSRHGVQIRSIKVFDQNGTQQGPERFLDPATDVQEVVLRSRISLPDTGANCGFQGDWTIGWDGTQGVLTSGVQTNPPHPIPEFCPLNGFNTDGSQNPNATDPGECTETVDLSISLTGGFPFKDVDPTGGQDFQNFLSSPILFSQFDGRISGFCTECPDRENALNHSGWGEGVFNTSFARGVPSVEGARVLGEAPNDLFGASMSLEAGDLFVIAPGRRDAAGQVRGQGYIFSVAGNNLWNTFGNDGAPGFANVDDNEDDNIVDFDPNGNPDLGELQWPGSDDQDYKPYQYQVNSGPIGEIGRVRDPDRFDPWEAERSDFAFAPPRGPGVFPINILPSAVRSPAPLEQIAGIPDFNNDTRRDVTVSAPTDFENGGAVYIIYRRAKALEGTINLRSLERNRFEEDRLAGVLIRGEKGSLLGSSITPVGDLNNDGFADVAYGAPGAKNAAGQVVGEVVVVFGGAGLQSPGQLDGDNISDPSTADGPGFTVQQLVDIGFAARIQGVADGDLTGFNVAVAGDADGDGEDDLLIAAPGAEPFFRTADGVLMPGTDRNGDGKADVLNTVDSEPIDSATELTDAGVVYLVYGSNDLTGIVSLADIGLPNLQGATFVGRHAGDQLGGGIETKRGNRSRGLAAVGDVDDDGVDDFIIGAMLADPDSKTDAGEAYLVLGKNAAPQN